MKLTDQIPGLAAAIERERYIRDTSFLPLRESIAGIDVDPLCLRNLIELSAFGSPFMVGGIATVQDIKAWFVVMNRPSNRFSKWRLLRKIDKADKAQLIKEIQIFTQESFMDSPATNGVDSASYYSFAASIVDALAFNYGWSEREILQTPIKRAFQYFNAIVIRNNPDATMFNPSDKVRGDWLREQNEAAKTN